MLESDMFIAVRYINKNIGMCEVILRSITSKGEVTKTIRGIFAGTTKNRLEILGIIAGLKSYKKPCRITVYSNHNNLIGPINNDWLDKWANDGWKTTKGEVKNKDLWQQVYFDDNYKNITVMPDKTNEFTKCQEISLDRYDAWNIKTMQDTIKL